MIKSLLTLVALTVVCIVGLSVGAKAQSLQLFASPTAIAADGHSTSTLYIYETACSTISGGVGLTVSGPGTVPAYVYVPLVQASTTSATACPTPYTIYRGNTQATLTSTTTPGTVVVTASATGVPSASATVTTTGVIKVRPIPLPVPPINDRRQLSAPTAPSASKK